MSYKSFNEEMKKRFGKKMYKLSFNAGMTCPNRDGKAGVGGCIFCDAGGSGDFAVDLDLMDMSNKTLDIKIQSAISKISEKTKPNECGFIAYFQAYTNTYDTIERLRKLYFPMINRPEISALAIATRPDCLAPDILDLLEELNNIKPIWIELGLQTIHEESAAFINRCYSLSVFEHALNELRERNIECVVHVILGLPKENREMMLDTVKYLSSKNIQGIKFSMLHILKGTRLEQIYEETPFHIFTLDEYAALIKDCLEILPKRITIHRLTGDGNKSKLVAPLWSGNKKKVLNKLKSSVS